MQKEGRTKYKTGGQQTFLVRDTEVTILGFLWAIRSLVATTQHCGCNRKAAILNYVNECLNLCFNKTLRALTFKLHTMFTYHKLLFVFFPTI